MFQKSAAFFVVLVLSSALLVVQGAYASLAGKIAFGGFLLSLVMLGIAFLVTLLEYSHYGIVLADDDIKITRGILREEEIGIPYRRVQRVDIERGIIDQLFGVSGLVIAMLGEEDRSGTQGAGSRVILPALDKDFAEEIQNALLKKADIEEMATVAKQ